MTTRDEMVEADRARDRPRSGTCPSGRSGSTSPAVSGDIASVVVHSAVYVEFVLLARVADRWRIIDSLWRWADGHGPRA